MPTWSTKLPPEGKHQGFDLKRTPASAVLQAVCTCENILVCDTHYWHGRTTPCERTVNEDGKTIDDSCCPACRDKQAWRTHAYVSAFQVKNADHFIFESTANAAKAFAEYFAAAGTLRGCGFYANRPKCGQNSKVVIVTTAVNLTKVILPNPPDVARALSVIWRLPQTALPVVEQQYEPPTIRPDASRLNMLRNQLDNAADPPTIGQVIGSNGHSKRKPIPC